MNDFRTRFIRFMSGRYGTDALNKFIFKVIIACFVLNLFGLHIFSKISLVLVIIYIFRAFSKNYNQRYQENQTYLKYSENMKWKIRKIKENINYKKTHKIFKCSSCGKKLSVPKGKGRIEISCPCGNKFLKKT